MTEADRLEAAMRNAHAAGDVNAARMFASDLRKLLSGPPSAGPVQGVADYAAHLGSSMVAKPVSEIAGLAALASDLVTGNRGDPSGFKREVQDRMTWAPHSAEGKWLSESLVNPLNLVGKVISTGANAAGDFVQGKEAAESFSGMAGNFVREAII